MSLAAWSVIAGLVLISGVSIVFVAVMFVHKRSRLVTMLVVGVLLLVSALVLMARLVGFTDVQPGGATGR